MRGRSGSSKRNLLDKASAAQSLDANRLTGSLLIPRSRTISDRSFNMQAADDAKLRFASSAILWSITTERRRTQHNDDCKIINRIDIPLATRHIPIVGPHCSRPAYPRHIAQALQLTRSSGRGLLAICLISHKAFRLLAALEPGLSAAARLAVAFSQALSHSQRR
jgi:hypothetical protein